MLKASRDIKAVRMPNQKFYAINEVTGISDAMALGLNNGKYRIYIHGFVEYTDIFGKNHWITYCYYLSKDGKVFHTYTEHNDTDDK